MSFIKMKKRTKAAFSLVEVLVVVFIMSVAFTSFYAVSTVGSKYIIEAKNRLAATSLANERMEIIRNLAYADVGLDEGVPSGKINQNEDVTANGRQYHIYTQIQYVDDPYDGLCESTCADSIPNDYKVVKVVVSWTDSNGQTKEVSSVSRFVPPGLETTAGGAPLAINIADSGGNAIGQASVHIVNNEVSPVINTIKQTDDDGHIMLPSMPASIGGYHFTITKGGYESVSTADITASFNPVYPHASVVLGSLNTYSYIQNQLSDLTVKAQDYQGNPIGDISFSIGGGKLLGYDGSNNIVYSMPAGNDSTGSSSGEKTYFDISSGSYTITMNADDQYEFIDYDPSATPAILAPDSSLTYTLRVADKSVNSLFLKISDADGNPIADANVTLKDSNGAEIFTDKKSSLRGILFYPDDATLLNNGEQYTIEIEAAGYQNESSTVTINGLTSKDVQLTN